MSNANHMHPAAEHRRLTRHVGVAGAVAMGLGSIVGTGVFVSIGIAAGLTGPSVVLAIALAAVVAGCNALSSAQLAASHPVSGGTYEYGYRYLRPWLGFIAGWMFLAAKSASAATAALGFAGYLLQASHADGDAGLVLVAIATVIALAAVVLAGLRQSNRLNYAVVAASITSLAVFVAAGMPHTLSAGRAAFDPFFSGDGLSFFHAAALMFVAYTGYGRIATLGEEVHEPRRTIPRAIIIMLAVSAALYVSVATIGVATAGASAMSASTTAAAAPLAVVAESFSFAPAASIVSLGAMAAMLGVLLNLVLGLSRVLLAMGRRGDMPRAVAAVNRAGTTPYVAVIAVGIVIAALASIGSVKTTWSFSAFTVLVYYSITNLATLRVAPEDRLFSPWIARVGLVSCLLLAFSIERQVWLAGLSVIAVGMVWHVVATRLNARSASRART